MYPGDVILVSTAIGILCGLSGYAIGIIRARIQCQEMMEALNRELHQYEECIEDVPYVSYLLRKQAD